MALGYRNLKQIKSYPKNSSSSYNLKFVLITELEILTINRTGKWTKDIGTECEKCNLKERLRHTGIKEFGTHSQCVCWGGGAVKAHTKDHVEVSEIYLQHYARIAD
jgi:hypothetical protein